MQLDKWRVLLGIVGSVGVSGVMGLVMISVGVLFNDVFAAEVVKRVVDSCTVGILLVGAGSFASGTSAVAILTVVEISLLYQAYRILHQTLHEWMGLNFFEFSVSVLLPELIKFLPVAKTLAVGRRPSLPTVALASSLAWAAMATVSADDKTSQFIKFSSPVFHLVCGLIDAAILWRPRSKALLPVAVASTAIFMHAVAILLRLQVPALAVALAAIVAVATVATVAVQTMQDWTGTVTARIREQRLNSTCSSTSDKLRMQLHPPSLAALSAAPEVSDASASTRDLSSV